MSVRAALLGVVFTVATAMLAGTPLAADLGAVRAAMHIVVFVDFSGSMHGKTMELFQQAFLDQIIPSLSAGDRLLIARISDKTLTEFHPLLDVSFPQKPEFSGLTDNVLNYNKQMKALESDVAQLKDSVRKQVAEIFARHRPAPWTDIFSSVILAHKLFQNEQRDKVLVIMSDMIEDYPPYRFEKVAWSEETIRSLIAQLNVKRLIPLLSGVCVYIAGASAPSAQLVVDIGRFWQAYFKQAGANLDSSRYAHVLLHWPPSKACFLPVDR